MRNEFTFDLDDEFTCDECGTVWHEENVAWECALNDRLGREDDEVDTVIECAYFAFCTNDAIGTLPNPVVGPVPTCKRCADKFGAADKLTLFAVNA